jgi:hypothetical protein
MLEFFRDGGWSMYPISVVGLVLLYSSVRYAADGQAVRLRFVAVLSFALLAISAQGFLVDVAQVLKVVATDERVQAMRLPILVEGLKECTSPVILGLSLWALALVAVAIGVARSGGKELRAARG